MNQKASEGHSKEMTFVSAAREAVGALTASISTLIDESPSIKGNRPIDISRGLGVNMKLAWKISHLATAASPFDAVRHLPGAQGLRIIIEAASQHGSSKSACNRVEQTFGQLQSFISTQAGSKRQFESMIAGVEESRDHRLEAEHRRLMFDGATSVWGIRVGCLYRLDILAPSGVKGLMDCSTLRSFFDVRRLRAGACLHFSRPRNIDDNGVISPTVHEEPIDPATPEGGFPLVHRFCEGDVPVFQPEENPGAGTTYITTKAEHADPSPFTATIGEVLRAIQPMVVSPRHHGIFQFMRMQVPAERVVFDVLLHRDLLDGDHHPEAYVTGNLQGAQYKVESLRRERLPVHVTMEKMELNSKNELLEGRSTREHVEATLSPLGRDCSEFSWDRMSLNYPPFPCTLTFECEQPMS